MTGRAVRLLSLGDVKAAGALLAASHGEYPAFRALAPDPAVRRRMLLQFQTAAVRDVVRNGRAYGAFAEGKLVGVALWQPPGRFPLSTARKLRMAPALLRSAAAAPSISAVSPLRGCTGREFPRELVWYYRRHGLSSHNLASSLGPGADVLRDDSTAAVFVSGTTARPRREFRTSGRIVSVAICSV